MSLKTIETLDRRPFKHFCATIGELPTSFIDSMSYYELLAWFCQYLEKTVIPTINENAEAVKELQDLFVELKDYVENYFANLDVQEEINNKLDEMAEGGQLADIIAGYLNLRGLLMYDTVSEMKNATNLVNGSFAKTLGYYEKNDGGGAFYKIRTVTNQDTEDEMFIIRMNDQSLVAELIIENGEININQVGGKANDSTFNNSPILLNVIKKATTEKTFSKVKLLCGEYNFSTPINLVSENIDLDAFTIEGSNQNYTGLMTGTIIKYTGSDYFMTVKRMRRSFVKCVKIMGDNTNKGMQFEGEVTKTNFEDVEFDDFMNHIWLKAYTGYVHFTRCSFVNNRNGCEGIILNQHYTDGRDTTGAINTEYVYFDECNMDAGNYSAKHFVIYQTMFLYITKCDLCNTSDTAIYIDGSGWKSVINDINITETSFVRNHSNFEIIAGDGEYRSIKINGNFTRKDASDTSESIAKIEGKRGKNIFNVLIEGFGETYANCNNAIKCNYVNTLNLNYMGEYRTNITNSLLVRKYGLFNVNPTIENVSPTVTTGTNSITFDFSNILENTSTVKILGSGVISGTSNGCNVVFEWLFGSLWGQKINGFGGSNITNVTSSGKTVTITTNSAYQPQASLDGMKFTLTR